MKQDSVAGLGPAYVMQVGVTQILLRENEIGI